MAISTEIEQTLSQLREPYSKASERRAGAERICALFLEGSTQQRQRIRQAFEDDYLFGRTFESSGWREHVYERLHATQDPLWLRYGLVGHSIEDNRADYRDVLHYLSVLWVEAEEAGIDPHPYFQEIAVLSSRVGRYDENNMADLMRHLHGSACLKQTRASRD